MDQESIESRLEVIQGLKTEFEVIKRERAKLFRQLKKTTPGIKGVKDAKRIIEEKEEELSELVEEKEILLEQISNTLDKYKERFEDDG